LSSFTDSGKYEMTAIAMPLIRGELGFVHE
jgi:hypothetical protein